MLQDGFTPLRHSRHGVYVCLAVPTLWVRRCRRCHTIDVRKIWDDPAAAHTDTSLDERPAWYLLRRPRWTCQACGSHDYTVDPAPPDDAR